MTSRRLAWAGVVTILVGVAVLTQHTVAPSVAAQAGGGRQGRGGPGGPQEQAEIKPGEECPPGMTEFRAGRCGKPASPPPSIVDYRPKSTVVADPHLVPKAKFPVIDIHNHTHGQRRQRRAVDPRDGQPQHPGAEQPVGRQRRRPEEECRLHPQQPVQGSLPAVRERRLERCGCDPAGGSRRSRRSRKA